VIKAESNGDSQAVSPAGAKGLMQLADSTATELGVNNPFDPRANVLGGSRYLRTLLDRFGDLRLALAAYNAGPATVERHGGVPPFRETHDYITRVTSYLQEIEKDQPTPLK
jgi:soluble lytic murein transglycosylase-like protein